MRALICSAPHQAEVIDTERVPPGPGEVLVRSRVVGVCHSDLELLARRYIIPIRYPGMSPGRPAQLMQHAPNTGRSEAASPRCRLRANPDQSVLWPTARPSRTLAAAGPGPRSWVTAGVAGRRRRG